MTSLADQPDFARKLSEITEEAAGIISALVETGSSDPAADLARLFDLTGVDHGLGEGGRLMLAAS